MTFLHQQPIKKGIALSVGTLLFLSIFLVTGMFIYKWSSKNNSLDITGRAIGETGVTGISNQQTIKREEIKQALVSSFIEALKEIEANGGYAKGYVNDYYPAKSFDYGMRYVAIYRACDENHYPSLEEIRQQLIARTQDYFNQKMEAYMQDDREFEFKGVNSLDIRILDGKAQLITDLNAMYKGYSLPSEYYVEVPTNLKKIHEFATNFTEMMSKLRLMEFYMIHLLYSAEDHYLPTGGMLTECGDGISISPQELTKRFDTLYSYLLSNVDFFKPLNLDEEDPPHYNLILVGSDSSKLQEFKGLSIVLRKPDDFAFAFNTGISISNNEWLSTSPLTPVAECIKRYDFSYSFPMAYVVSIKDDLVGGDVVYNFAEYGYVNNMVPDDECGYDDLPDNSLVMSPSIVDGIQDQGSNYAPLSLPSSNDCSNYNKEIALWVKDKTSRKPLSNADVYYKGCYVGKTNDAGFIKVPYYLNSNEAVLSVSKQGYAPVEYLLDQYSSSLTLLLYPLKERTISLKYIYVHAHLTPKPEYDYMHNLINYPNYGYSVDLSSHYRDFLSRNALLWVDYCEIKDHFMEGENYEGAITFSQDSFMSIDENADVRAEILSDSYKFSTGTQFTSNQQTLNLELPPTNLYVDLWMFKPFVSYSGGVSDYKEISRVRYLMRSTSSPSLVVYIPLIKIDENRVSEAYEVNGFLNTNAAALAKFNSNNPVDIMHFYETQMVDLIKNGCGMNLYGTQRYDRTYSVNTGLPSKYVCSRLKTIAFSCGNMQIYNEISTSLCRIDTQHCCDIENIINRLKADGCNIIEANTIFS